MEKVLDARQAVEIDRGWIVDGKGQDLSLGEEVILDWGEKRASAEVIGIERYAGYGGDVDGGCPLSGG